MTSTCRLRVRIIPGSQVSSLLSVYIQAEVDPVLVIDGSRNRIFIVLSSMFHVDSESSALDIKVEHFRPIFFKESVEDAVLVRFLHGVRQGLIKVGNTRERVHVTINDGFGEQIVIATSFLRLAVGELQLEQLCWFDRRFDRRISGSNVDEVDFCTFNGHVRVGV